MTVKTKKILLASIGILLVLSLSITYGYFAGGAGPGAFTDVNVGSGHSTKLIFTKGSDINLILNETTLAEGGGNVTGSTTSTAQLILGDGVNSATDSYNAYFMIPENNYVYTTSDSKPEIILTIEDPEGNFVTISDLSQATVTDAVTGEVITGYDVTEKSGFIKIVENYSISGSSDVTHNWDAKLTFVNLDTNQALNEGKTFEGELILQKEKMDEPSDVFIKVADSYNQGPYNEVTCDSGTAVWDAKYSSIRISSISPFTECELKETSGVGTTKLNDYIISLAGTVQGNGEVVDENGYRYQGKNPNNYIWFNNELWRIIGVLETTLADGITKQNLVKIIKDETIGGYYANNILDNSWTGSSLERILNTIYLFSEDGSESGLCNISPLCDFRFTGIGNSYANFIENVMWSALNSSYNARFTAAEYYEREQNSLEDKSKISLISLSDYGYSVLEDDCSRTRSIESYNYCAPNSWIFKYSSIWTLNRFSQEGTSTFAWVINSLGIIDGANLIIEQHMVLPSLYLNDAVKYTGGDGSYDSPYLIEN